MDEIGAHRRVRAVVMGGYVNGYGIVKSLHEAGVANIWVVDQGRSVASRSRWVSGFEVLTDDSHDELLRVFKLLGSDGHFLVPFPTNDAHVEFLARCRADLGDNVFIPVNPMNAVEAQDKAWQYKHVAPLRGVRAPKTLDLAPGDDLEATLGKLPFPMVCKPKSRTRASGGRAAAAPFRIHLLNGPESSIEPLREALGAGWTLMVSEIIPGKDDDIYAYTAYRNARGKILGEWCGRKLSQYPTRFGVFASASNEAVPGLLEAGRKVVTEIDAVGIIEPEFKQDPRTGELVLMEVNLRSMMWHRVGALSGVNLPAVQYRDALDLPPVHQRQSNTPVTHTYFAHELAGLVARPWYARRLFKILTRPGRREWVFFEVSDPLPFFAALPMVGRLVVQACLSRFR
ncbi:hypothetical protein [Janibacter indicus]|uniref:carboxylate--amine ligase n=1 Tax=Janibacter indicus TaxID=857417 RepID=UPI003D9A394D